MNILTPERALTSVGVGVGVGEWPLHASHVHSRGTIGVFYTYFYNHAHRLRLEKLSYLELYRSPNGFLKPLMGPCGGFASGTAERQFH